MNLGTVNLVIFLCFIFKRAVSARVLIVDIPEVDSDAIIDHDYVYYDYEQIIPTPKIKVPKPVQVENLPLSQKNARLCERFGSMYGIDPTKHKCRLLVRINEKMKQEQESYRQSKVKKREQDKEGNGKGFAQDYVDDFWRSAKKEPSKFAKDDFSQDYADDLWRTLKSRKYPTTCTLSDIINHNCNLNLQASNNLKLNRFYDSRTDGVKTTKSKNGKEKPSDFAQDYVDDLWRSKTTNDPSECSLSDVLNNKCKLNLVGSKRTNKNRLSNSKPSRSKKVRQEQETDSVLTDETKDDLATALFALDYVDESWSDRVDNGPSCSLRDIVNQKCRLNADALKSNHSDSKPAKKKQSYTDGDILPLFASDYLDDFGRSRSNNDEQFLDRLCESRSNDPFCVTRRNNWFQIRSSRFSDSSASEEKPKGKRGHQKPKRFQIVKNKKKKFKKDKSDSDTNESENSSDEEPVKPNQPEWKPNDIKSEDSGTENVLTDIEEVDTSDSFETGPKKPEERYEYLQGHRLVKPKTIRSVRRASRLQTFLPKRYFWKQEDLHNLGYFWFEGPVLPDDKPN